VASSDIREHIMHAEWCRVPTEAARQLAATRAAGGRVVAVGTTSLRTLETAVPQVGWQPWEGESQLFVYPPYRFQAVDVLLTNFHLPKSTLLMLVSAFGGYELIREAYAAAIAERYRFFSYGDAMLIL
jgi:S-adenosylmethionine:tRNA ribosyltransferase-isomerase